MAWQLYRRKCEDPPKFHRARSGQKPPLLLVPGRNPLYPDADVWEAAGDHARFQVWSGDRFIVEPNNTPNVILVRLFPRKDFEEMQKEAPGLLHLIRRALRRFLRVV